MVFSTDGFVSRVFDAGGGDKYIHLITPERGRLRVLVKGGKSLLGEQTSCSQPFVYGNYEISCRNGLYWLRKGSVLVPFYVLSDDLSVLALATYLCEVADDLTGEGENAGRLMQLLLNCIYGLDRRIRPPKQVKAVFELLAAVLSGYCPDLFECAECGKETAETMYVDVMNGALLCADCLAKRNEMPVVHGTYAEELREATILCRLTPRALEAARYVMTAPPSRILSFSFEQKEDAELFFAFTETYLLNHLERGFSSLTFYKETERNAK